MITHNSTIFLDFNVGYCRDIVDDMSQASYPKEPYYSFLDHILVPRSFLNDKDYIIKTIRMGDYMGGFNNYEKLISDHLPVFLSF